MIIMKILPLGMIFTVLAFLPAAAQLSQTKLATLGKGEVIVVQESVLLSGTGPGCASENFFIVSQTTASGTSRFYVYDKAGRKGPFDKISESMLRAGAGFEPKPAYYDEEASIEGFEETDPRGSFSFRGKKYGQFQQIQRVQVSADRAQFYALVAKAGKLRFISSDGRDVPAGGMPEAIKISPDGTKAVAVCRGSLTLIEGVQVDMSKIDPSSFDEVSLYTIDGAKLGPFSKGQDFGEVWFAAGSGNWLFDLGSSIYLNGSLLRKFSERIDKSTFWVDDATHFAWVEAEELRFSEGAKYPGPVMIRHEKIAGKTTLCWISVQNNGDVVAFRRNL